MFQNSHQLNEVFSVLETPANGNNHRGTIGEGALLPTPVPLLRWDWKKSHKKDTTRKVKRRFPSFSISSLTAVEATTDNKIFLFEEPRRPGNKTREGMRVGTKAFRGGSLINPAPRKRRQKISPSLMQKESNRLFCKFSALPQKP